MSLTAGYRGGWIDFSSASNAFGFATLKERSTTSTMTTDDC
jgi:hypothetical protein